MSFMKVVAVATIADAVPLLGENRVFASLGLKGLRSPVNAGLKALLNDWLEGVYTATDLDAALAARVSR